MMTIQNLALPERTYYEPLASTHPDTQGGGDNRQVVLTIASKEALTRVMRKIKQMTGAQTTSLRLSQVLRKINPILRG